MAVVVGTRVVRGPDWEWEDQDLGEGHVGTVIEVGKGDVGDRPDKTVIVLWDCGKRNNYRAGFNNRYDLRIFDNAQAGVAHAGVSCSACKQDGICGIRWQCFRCFNSNLCSPCFMHGSHQLDHDFRRFATPESTETKLYNRSGARQVEAKGLFPGAKVLRGKDWRYGDQDGGDISFPGNVVDIHRWGSDGNRAAVLVRWPGTSSDKRYRYRVGADGKVDVKCVKPAESGKYYPDLLPKLGEAEPLQVGDTVIIDLTKDSIKSSLKERAGEKGVIKEVTGKGELSVQYNCGQIINIDPADVQKVSAFSVGDRVRVIKDREKAEELQKGHGGWNSSMSKILGKEAKVEQVFKDGDVKVSISVGSKSVNLLFHPECLELIESHQQPKGDTFEQGQQGFHSLLDQTGGVTSVPTEESEKKRLNKAAAMGRLDDTREILAKHPEWAHQQHSGRTPLQVAAHQGHLNVIKELMKYRPSLEVTDADGDTAFLYAAYGNKPDVIEYLISCHCNVRALNKQRRSGLHIAARRGHVECVRILLEKGVNCNLQDNAGDLALHDAIQKDMREVITCLVQWKRADLTIRNNKGLSVLHYAALRGNAHATECLVTQARHLVDTRKDNGQTPLHIAASNNFKEVARLLVHKGKCAVNVFDNQKHTPLLIAVAGGHVEIMELLIEAGADVNASDVDGDTCLHMAAIRFKHNPSGVEEEALHQLCEGTVKSSLLEIPGLSLLVYLIKNGARIDLPNHSGCTPLQLIQRKSLVKQLSKLAAKSQKSPPQSVTQPVISDESVSRVNNLRITNHDESPHQEQHPQHQQQQQQTQPPQHHKQPCGSNAAGGFEGVHRIEVSELKITEKIGRGSYGQVSKGRWRGTTVAIKRMSIEGSKRSDIEKEVDIHKQAMHPNIVQLMALGYSDMNAYLVMTYVNGTDMQTAILSEDKWEIATVQKYHIARDVLSALTYMHASGLLHLDIKPSNILLEKVTFKPYLCDMGLSHVKRRASMLLSSRIAHPRGTPMYMPPEMHERNSSISITGAQDIWSTACTFIELFGEIPVHSPTMTMWGLVKRFTRGQLKPESLSKLDPQLQTILEPCFQEDPKVRPSANELLDRFEELCEAS